MKWYCVHLEFEINISSQGKLMIIDTVLCEELLDVRVRTHCKAYYTVSFETL